MTGRADKRLTWHVVLLGLAIVASVALVIWSPGDDGPPPRVVTLRMSWRYYWTEDGAEDGNDEFTVIDVDSGVRVDVDIALVGNGPTDAVPAMERFCASLGGERVVGTVCQGVSLVLLAADR